MELCTVEPCDRPVSKRLMCGRHYLRWWRHGDPEREARPQIESCGVGDCGKAPRTPTSGICEMHYARQRRHGDPLTVRPTTGRTVSSGGYALVRRPGHPVARKSGWAFEHRVVLYDLIGGGVHPCHWCGTSVSWEKRYPEHLDALVVDHCDRDQLNNAASNLVPSCYHCNLNRGRDTPSGSCDVDLR